MKKIYVIHENDAWVDPLRAAFAELDLPYKWAKYEEIDALWYRDKDAARAMVEVVKTKA